MESLQLLNLQELNRVPASATLAINEKSKSLLSQGKKVIQFGFGQSPFPVPDEVVEQLKINASRKEYAPVQGLEKLRKAVQGYYQKNFDLSFDADNIMIGPGSKELIFLIQMSYTRGLFLPAPSWVSYSPQAQICGKPVTWIPTDEKDHWTLTGEQLSEACDLNPQHRLLILNNPSNPTGSSINESRARQLAEIARKHQLVVISDEIYGSLQFDGPFKSMASFYPEGTIVTGGLSKWCGAGGWRLGTAAFPTELVSLLGAVKGMASETFTAVSTPVQMAAVKAYTGSQEIEKYLKNCKSILKVMAQYVHRHLEAAGITMPPASGGFYLFPNFRSYKNACHKQGLHTSDLLCQKLLDDTGVALLPGSDFGRPPEELTTRLAFVDFDGESALQWLNKNQHTPDWQEKLPEICGSRVVTGVNKLADWVNDLKP